MKPLGIGLAYFSDAAFSGKFAFPLCKHSIRHDWQVHFKELFVYGDNFLQECGGQQFWCSVGSWREPVMQRFDGLLLVCFMYEPNHNHIISDAVDCIALNY